MGGRLYVVYPRFLSKRDVEFIYRTSERIVVAAVRESGETLEQMMQKAREETGIRNGDIAEHAAFIRALGESMCLQRGQLTNFVLREGGEDLLEVEEGSLDVPPVLETRFGEVVRADRQGHGTEENTPGTRVRPEGAIRLGGKVSSRDQFGPFRQRRRSLGKPYAPKEKDTRRPTVETKSKAKRQVPSYNPEESDTDDEEPETSRTLGSSSHDRMPNVSP
jgi:hypothetical protein